MGNKPATLKIGPESIKISIEKWKPKRLLILEKKEWKKAGTVADQVPLTAPIKRDKDS